MDPYENSSLFTRYRRYIPSLVGAGASALAAAYFGGQRAKTAIDSEPPGFPTGSRFSYSRSRRNMYRRRRAMRRRAARRPSRPTPSPTVEIIKQHCLLGTTTFASAADLPSIWSFKLGDLNDAGSIAGVWARYRFRWVKLTFMATSDPGNTAQGGTVAAANPVIQIITAADTGKTSTPATSGEVLEYRDARVGYLGGGKVHSHFVWRPTPANTVAGSNVPGGAQWITTSNSTIPHYSIIGVFRNIAANQGVAVYATYCLEVAGRY